MSHYHITVPVDKEDVVVIKKELLEYLDKCGTITISLNVGDAAKNKEIEMVLRKLFVRLTVLVCEGQFEGLN